MIHPGPRLGEIGEADPEFDQRRELAWLIAPRRDAGLMQRAPEAVAGMGVVVPELGRARRGGGADEDEAEVGTELVGEAVERTIVCAHGSHRSHLLVDFGRVAEIDKYSFKETVL